jgi:hypothetical protein
MRNLLFIFAAVLTASNAILAGEADGPAKADGFTIHEWGVFTRYANQAFANAGRDAAWKELPPEVCGVTPGREIPSHCAGADKPVIYFYNTDALQSTAGWCGDQIPVKIHGARHEGNQFKWDVRKINVRVNFPGGAPLVWYPKTSEPQGAWWGSGKRGGDVAPPMSQFSSIHGGPEHLTWELSFPVSTEAPEIKCPAYTWREEALQAKADPFSVDYYLQDCQKFLFYEGLVPNKNEVYLRKESGKFFVANISMIDALDLWVIERSTDKLKIGHYDNLKATPAHTDLPETEVKADLVDGSDAASKKLAEQLIAAGLFRSEAEGIANIWKKEFFETPGLHMLYRFPQGEYDRLLPLDINPKPKKVVRTGLAWIPHLEPDLKDRVAKLVQQLGDDDFVKREEGCKQLLAIGPAALPYLKEQLDSTKDEEIRSRINGLLNAYTLDPEKHLELWKKLSEKNRRE